MKTSFGAFLKVSDPSRRTFKSSREVCRSRVGKPFPEGAKNLKERKRCQKKPQSI